MGRKCFEHPPNEGVPPMRMGVHLTKIARFFLTAPELRLQPIFSTLREDRLKP